MKSYHMTVLKVTRWKL